MTKLNEIIRFIGRKRFIFFMILLLFTIGLGVVWQLWMMPHHDSLISEKGQVENDHNRLQAEINAMPGKYKELSGNEALYQKLVDKGFTLSQDRIFARSQMDALRVKTGLRGISYDIAPQVIEKPPEGVNTEDSIIHSTIAVEMKGLTDLEMRDFIEKMTKEFRGVVLLKNFSLKIEKEPTPDNLKELSKKTKMDFVTGKASFDWYTVLPKPSDSPIANTMAPNAATAAPAAPGTPAGLPGAPPAAPATVPAGATGGKP